MVSVGSRKAGAKLILKGSDAFIAGSEDQSAEAKLGQFLTLADQ